MAKVNAALDMRATPQQILAVIADLASYPEWSAVHKRASVEASFPDGRPQRATMSVAAMGLTDTQVLDYQWSAQGVSWTLVKSGQQRDQRGSYSITPGTKGVSRVSYELRIDPAIPLPAMIVRQVMKKAVKAATEGLKHRVESLG